MPKNSQNQDGASPFNDPKCANCGHPYTAHWSGQNLCPGLKGERAFRDGASAAGPRDAYAYELGLVREVVQEPQPSTAPAAQGEAPKLLAVAMELLEEWPLPKMGSPLREELADARRELRRAYKAHKKEAAQPPAASQGMPQDVRDGLHLILRAYIYTNYGVIGAAKAWIESALSAPAEPQGMREAVDLAVRPWQSGEPIMDADDLRDLIQEYADADREYHSMPEGPGTKGVLKERNEAMHRAIEGFADWVKYARRAALSRSQEAPDLGKCIRCGSVARRKADGGWLCTKDSCRATYWEPVEAPAKEGGA